MAGSACGTFSMSPEQAAVLADEPRLVEAFKTGRGVGWGDRCNCLFCCVEKFFRPGYKAHLVDEWRPALDGVTAKLEAGAASPTSAAATAPRR